MKHKILKSAITAIVVLLGALVAAPASAACVLCTLSQNGDWDGIDSLLAKRPAIYEGTDAQSIDINGQGSGGETALILAARYNHLQIVAGLLSDSEQPADANLANNQGRTALMWAAQNGYLDIAFELVERGDANIHAVGTKRNKSALRLAMDNERYDLIVYLINKGATPDYAPKTLEYAVDTENRDLVMGILEHEGVDFAHNGSPSLLFAGAVHGALDFVKATHADGGNCLIEQNGKRPVDVAHENGHDSVVNYLLSEDCGTPTCPQGEHWLDGQCTPIDTPEKCAMQEQIFVDENCVDCPSGQNPVGDGLTCETPLTVADCNEQDKILHNGECLSCNGLTFYLDAEVQRVGNECTEPSIHYCRSVGKTRVNQPIIHAKFANHPRTYNAYCRRCYRNNVPVSCGSGSNPDAGGGGHGPEGLQ